MLEYTGAAYELTTEITWDELAGAGVHLRRSADGSRHIDAGVHGDYAFVNRRGSANPDTSGEWQESRSPFAGGGQGPAARPRRPHHRRGLLRRRAPHPFHGGVPCLVDTGLALFTSEGPAVLKSTVIREFTG